MSFVPVTGPATFRAAEPPREGVVEFTDDRRTVALPIRAALPVLTKAHTRDDLHPSVGLLSGAALLAMRLVAAGKFEPGAASPSWRIAALDADDERPGRACWPRRGPTTALDADAAEAVVRAGARRGRRRDAPRAAGRRAVTAAPARAAARRAVAGRAAGVRRPAAGRGSPGTGPRARRPAPAGDALAAGRGRRGGAGRRRRAAGAPGPRRADPLHVCDAALLWTESGPDASHGFGDRARTHAAHRAARPRPTPGRCSTGCSSCGCPTRSPSTPTSSSACSRTASAALQRGGVDVLWPRSLGRDLTATAVLDRARPAPRARASCVDGHASAPDALFAFNWQLALHGDPLTEEEMDQLAAAPARCSGCAAAGPSSTRRSPARPASGWSARSSRPQAVAAALTGVVAGRATPSRSRSSSAPRLLEGPRAAARRRRPASPSPSPAGLRGDPARLPAPRADLAGRADLARPRRLPGRRHGPGQDDHADRAAPAPASSRATPGPTLVVCPASLLGNWEAEIARFAPGRRRCAASTAAAASLDGLTPAGSC